MTRQWMGRHARSAAALFGVLALSAPAAAQGGEEHDHAEHGMSSHAGTGSEEVQTLTPDEVTQLLEGAGMGLARPAEMNGYPGPRHVLELADSLALTAEQRAETEAIFRSMQRRAIDAGRQIIDAERLLDRAFAEGAEPGHVERLVHDIARLNGELRWTHLRAHFQVTQLLTRHQRHEYHRLRGYGS